MSKEKEFIKVISTPIVPKEQEFKGLIEKSVEENVKTGQKYFIDGAFAQAFIKINDLVFSNGAFYTPNGMESAGQVKKDISESIYEVFPSNLSQNTNKAFASVKDLSYEEGFDFADKLIIPFNNGDLKINNLNNKWEFYLDLKRPAPYRLPVDYTPLGYFKDTPNFNKWLNDLFDEEDIITLQEYIGYCLMPTTRGQKALLIIGDGGVGKSVLSEILYTIFGKAMIAPHDINDFFKDKFKLAELENKLIVYEDDLSEKMLSETGVFKKLITNQSYIMADRKGENPFQFKPYSRFIMLGNDMLKSKYDISEGFFRRLLPLRTKPKDNLRKNIPNFGNLITKEKDGITQWAILGLYRLIQNNWQFTISNKTKAYMKEFTGMQNHFPEFIQDSLEFGEDYDFSTQELKMAYAYWCENLDVEPRNIRTLENWISNNANNYNLKYGNKIERNKMKKRGYKGAKLKNGALIYVKDSKIQLK